jgi:hypothetical protein
MRRTVVVLAMLVMAFTVLAAAGPAQAATRWPARCTNFRCVNAHLNNLNKRTSALKQTVRLDEFLLTETVICQGDALVNESQGDPDQATGITGATGAIGPTLGVDCNTVYWPIFDPSQYTGQPTTHAPANSAVLFRMRLLFKHLG